MLLPSSLQSKRIATTAFANTDEPPPQTPAKASKFEKRGDHDCKRGERQRDSLGDLY